MKWGGYTIVEVMIVLAVSSAMFLGAAALISGKQGSAQFNTSVHNFTSQLNAVAQTVSDGDFSTTQNWQCNTTSATPPVVTPTTGGGTGYCMYIGQVMQLPTNSNSFVLTPLIGAQYVGGVAPSANSVLSQTIADSGAAAITGSQQTNLIGNGVSVGCVLYTTTVKTPDANQPCRTSGFSTTDAIAFLFTNYGKTVTSATPTGTTSAQVNMVLPKSVNTALNSSTYTSSGNYVSNPAGGVIVCLQSATTKQFALVQFGGVQSQFSAQSTIASGSCS